MTNNIARRVGEHKDGEVSGFSNTYNCERLVWFERYQYVGNAIAREKQIKKWRREKKIALVDTINSSWIDLSEGWF
jgi:putative endonuclease